MRRISERTSLQPHKICKADNLLLPRRACVEVPGTCWYLLLTALKGRYHAGSVMGGRLRAMCHHPGTTRVQSHNMSKAGKLLLPKAEGACITALFLLAYFCPIIGRCTCRERDGWRAATHVVHPWKDLGAEREQSRQSAAAKRGMQLQIPLPPLRFFLRSPKEVQDIYHLQRINNR